MQFLPSSYKDPSGNVFALDGEIFRTVNECYRDHYHQLMNSGLYQKLTERKLLVEHIATDQLPPDKNVFLIIKPTQIPLISYAYEWCFSMLRDAAVCTLDNALFALEDNMILKDANTFNIQFYQGNPIQIDTLSYEIYTEGEPWIAYRQFCENFLAPLVLMKYCNLSLNKLLIAYPNGIPLDICKSMLPLKARFNLHVFLHIFIQTDITQSAQGKRKPKQFLSKQKLTTLLKGLKDFIKNLKSKNDKTIWDNYYNETILSKQYLDEKKKVVFALLQKTNFHSMLDLGANEGEFSMMYQHTDKTIFSVDEDRHCIEKLYLQCKEKKINNLLPLIVDMTAPSPAIGWNNKERTAIWNRLHPDVTVALALIHHLCIAHNITIKQFVDLLYNLSEYSLVEFVEKEDEKVKILLQNRKDIFTHYTIEDFRKIVSEKFLIVEEKIFEFVKTRTLFLLKRK